MKTGQCQFPEHHNSPSSGPPFALLGAIALGALIIGFWHQIVVALVVVAILACVAGAVFLLIHNHGSGYDPELERQAEAARFERGRELAAAARAAEMEAEIKRRQIEAPAVHHHLHLHGVSSQDMAELVTRQQDPRQAPDRSQQC